MREIVIERRERPPQRIPENENLGRGEVGRLFYQLYDSLLLIASGVDPDTLDPFAYLDENGMHRHIWMKSVLRVRIIEGATDCTARFLAAR